MSAVGAEAGDCAAHPRLADNFEGVIAGSLLELDVFGICHFQIAPEFGQVLARPADPRDRHHLELLTRLALPR